ncbi:MAG: symmetrical bis(5'-nucleosyl)-tetraphosphatase [Gammaproteobacteria bacterium]|nr:symmetrical bis(5'-nucleosyl)-tetraphosphatase [Gammaproteobacteria bacterium]
MARYVIGDVQGCFDQLTALLQLVDFNSDRDQVWFCGDLIARGPKSLECLRFIRDLADNAITVLGNHDLNFLASLYGFGKISAADQLTALQQAPDKQLLADWLIQQPLLYHEPQHNLVLVHAGLAPEWDLPTAIIASQKVEAALSQRPEAVFSQMYGNTPTLWSEAITEADKLRFSINSLTRMRYCYSDGRLELKEKGEVTTNPALKPWFEFWNHRQRPEIFFGHWAALQGQCSVQKIHALDTGCVWGNSLTAYCIETQRRYSVIGYKKQL